MQGQTEGIARADSSEWDGIWGFHNWLGPRSPLSADSPCYRHSSGATEISFALKCNEKWMLLSFFRGSFGSFVYHCFGLRRFRVCYNDMNSGTPLERDSRSSHAASEAHALLSEIGLGTQVYG